MILWDRIKKSLDAGIEHVTRVAGVVSERVRIESAVARLLIDKGGLETRLDRCHKRLGERLHVLWDQKHEGSVMADPEVAAFLGEASGLKEKIEILNEDIKKVTVGEEEYK